MATRTATRLLTFGSDAQQRRLDQLDVHVVANAWHVRGQANNPVSAALLPEVLRADVVHCHQQHIVMSSAAAVLCRLTGRRVFVTDLGGGGWDISAYVSTDGWYDGHLHISEYSRSVYGHAGQPWARVILGGVDTDRFSPEHMARRTRTALFVGRLLPHKGISDLIAAMPDELALDIVGPGNVTGYVETLQAEAAGKAVRFRHGVSDHELVSIYRRALCLVLPSVYQMPDGRATKVPELLGQTLLEAMACGTPVICTRVASMPEIVEDGVTGFIVDPGDREMLRDRLRWYASHPAEAAEMGAAGRRAVLNRFQWRQVVQRCLDAYSA
jgi:glycosyltransferase involved in cell wall biosynthesis